MAERAKEVALTGVSGLELLLYNRVKAFVRYIASRCLTPGVITSISKPVRTFPTKQTERVPLES